MNLLKNLREIHQRGVDLARAAFNLGGSMGSAQRELAELLGIPRKEANQWLRVADTLFGRCEQDWSAYRDETVQLMQNHNLSIQQLCVVDRYSRRAPKGQRYPMCRELTHLAAKARSLEELEDVAREKLRQLTPDVRRRAEALRGISYSRSADADGQLHVMARGPVAEMERVIGAIERATAKNWDREGNRSYSQAMFDNFVTLITGAQNGQPADNAYQPAVVIRVEELDRETLPSQEGRQFMLSTGETITTREYLEMKLNNSGWVLVKDRDNYPVELHRIHRRFATDAQRFAMGCDEGTCGHPGCTFRSDICQAHHIQPWSEGGKTSVENMVLLCPRHHSWIQPGRDRVQKGENARVEWVGRNGIPREGRGPSDAVKGQVLTARD
ncbi:hypothetical protein GP475_00385 [Corynebacterium poyangense]|uniref:Uncharacterized protein n=1 Tax=Corynebacterium poyangense TaxID=2684405 RepID=A0A7H0SL31_9CORY|nr:HNH endonuclease signature motif containing protein [Corynebacterium poyangense]MBZ8177344.1 hypothetical protein [Corynebacterium poyangense]QNQ89256.1 hypothetical protein GP475_00385 [Corynebacterium poyangense]